MIMIPVSVGELIDKITILEIKAVMITEPSKLENVQHELKLLNGVKNQHVTQTEEFETLASELKHINQQLWNVEDDIREQEAQKKFEGTFIALARSVYELNDERARLKRDISLLLGSEVLEEKSYHPTA
ncbi:MAG: hypothetical protein COB37_06385 [Kordiimonadales bacterium]|nr:MAG: hypothetical protein COB37_06385 [Kordiimonadales bacterium]